MDEQKTVEEICLDCNSKQEMSIIAKGTSGILMDEEKKTLLLKCPQGHYEIKNEDGSFDHYVPNKAYTETNKLY